MKGGAMMEGFHEGDSVKKGFHERGFHEVKGVP